MAEPRPLELLEWISHFADLAEECERLRGSDEISERILNAALCHAVEMTGEAVGTLLRSTQVDLREHFPEVPWRELVGIRVVLAHKYFAVDIDLVRATAARILPMLREVVPRIAVMISSRA